MKHAIFADHPLENGGALHAPTLAYQSWGRLNAARNNAVVVCHALTGGPDADGWWGGLVGPGRVLDTERYFVICMGVLGSPYGTASPLTDDPQTGRPYGPAFPRVTIRDTVGLHRRMLRRLGVRRVALAVGGSMGGMQVLEWAFAQDEKGEPFVQALCPVAVGGRHTAWQIGHGEAQRQAIYADPNWQGGRYAKEAPPAAGLAAARMMAMVSYRAPASFAERFGRARMPAPNGAPAFEKQPFAVESYLRYQGQKLVERFDANCYVRLTQQMDTHDVARGRGPYTEVLASITQPALVIGIHTDLLYPLSDQEELAAHLPNAELAVLRSPHGHDAFLIEQDALAEALRPWMARHVRPAEAARCSS